MNTKQRTSELNKLNLKQLKEKYPTIKAKKKANFIKEVIDIETEIEAEAKEHLKNITIPKEEPPKKQQEPGEGVPSPKEDLLEKKQQMEFEEERRRFQEAERLRRLQQEKEAIVFFVNMRKRLDFIKELASTRNIVDKETINSLFLGRCWLGKCLGHLNQTNPYDQEEKVTKPEDIPPAADLHEDPDNSVKYRFKLMTDTEAIVSLRFRIEEEIKAISRHKKKWNHLPDYSYPMIFAETNLIVARFYLGRILDKLRK